ncbi:uncharacterized protein LOC111638098 [Centruroides sculpturatus]|uniref:uncharacterized protein LOC111638098 n=1 Tax=Centruroides sculpturatus TaxID=218467 RepID=UPI000C6CB4F1|nr:uncharacterized protein LOC111638098 [Centruroides sculpturatus]
MYPSITWDLIEEKLNNLDVNKEIIELIEFTYRSNYFETNGEYYTQTDGISMGSVIGPKLAELIMIDIDNIICNIPGIKFYKRYVDDILIIYDETEIKIEEINKQTNSIHKAIKFKIETEDITRQSINYLDITITRLKHHLEYRTFKKPSSNQVTTRYQSKIPSYIKYNIYKMEYDKIINRTSQEAHINEDLMELRKKFLLAGFPQRLLKQWETRIKDPRNLCKNKDKQVTKTKYINFPYIRGLYEQISAEIEKINYKLAPSYQKMESRLLTTNQKKNQQIPIENQGVVYKIPCTCANKKHYIGETKRKVKTRLKEHIADLKYNRINSAFYEHCTINNCNIDKDNVEILHKEKLTYNRKFKETIEIMKSKDSINKNLSLKINENWINIL